MEQLTGEQNALLTRLGQARASASNGDCRGMADLHVLAANGSCEAMMMLGEEYGLGPFRDLAQSELWFKAAYEAVPSNWTAFRLGQFYFVNSDFAKAEEIFRQGSSSDFGLCTYWLAKMYLRDPEQRYARASYIRQLLARASSLGYAWASRKLSALLLMNFYGVAGLPTGLWYYFVAIVQVLAIGARDPHDIRLRR